MLDHELIDSAEQQDDAPKQDQYSEPHRVSGFPPPHQISRLFRPKDDRAAVSRSPSGCESIRKRATFAADSYSICALSRSWELQLPRLRPTRRRHDETERAPTSLRIP